MSLPSYLNSVAATPPPASVPAQPKKLEGRIKLSDFVVGRSQNPLSEAVVTHQLRNAASRVFADPLRSFLELVVNALDASNPEDVAIGKFGMGFLSNLAFLQLPETSGCSLVLETTYRKGTGFCSYRHIITSQNGIPTIEHIDLPPKQTTGTELHIIPNVGEFSKETLATIEDYCHDLTFYPHGNVEINGQQQIGLGRNTQAWVTLSGKALCVRDKGCGITEEISRTKLYVPSASSKRSRQLDQKVDVEPLPEPIQWKRNKEGHRCCLFLVDGIIACKIAFKDTFLEEDLLIKFPPGTSIPLARNTIELNLSARLFLGKIVECTIRAVLTKKQEPEILLALYRTLSGLKDQNLARQLLETLQKALKAEKIIAIPLEYDEEFSRLVKKVKVLPLPSELVSHDFSSLETFLSEHLKPDLNLIAGKKVIFMRINHVTSLGLNSFIFAPFPIMEKAKEEATKEISAEQRAAFSLVMSYVEDGKKISLHDSLQKGPKRSRLGKSFLSAEKVPPKPKTRFYPMEALTKGLFRKQPDALFTQLYNEYKDLIHIYLQTGRDLISWKQETDTFTIKKNEVEETYIVVNKEAIAKIALEKILIDMEIMTIAFGDEVITPDTPLSQDDIKNIFLSITRSDVTSPTLPLVHLPAIRALTERDIQDLAAFCDYEKGLKQSFIPNLLPLVQLRQLALKAQIDELVKEKLMQFISRTFGYYHEFFRIPLDKVPNPRDLKVPAYAHNSYHATLKAQSHLLFFDELLGKPNFSTITIETLIAMLSRLKPVTSIKLISLLEGSLREALKPSSRDRYFKQNLKLRIPNLMHSDLLGFLTFVCQKGVLLKAETELLIENVKDHNEFNLLLSFLEPLRPPAAKDRERFASVLKALLTQYIRNLPTTSVIQILIHNAKIREGTTTEGLLPKDVEAIQKYLKDFFKESPLPEAPFFIPPSYLSSFEKAPFFTTNQLLNAIQVVDFSKVQTLNDFHKALIPISPQTTMNMVNQCVEHATDRDIMQSCLQELAQNAGDAIINLKHHSQRFDNRIIFFVEILKNKEGAPQLLLTVRDFAGMQDLHTLLLHIPNFSRKNSKLGMGGEMGNGSFQIYKEAELVTRKTRLLDGRAFVQKTVVLRGSTGEVYDLQHKCVELDVSQGAPDAGYYGTEIRILFRNNGKSFEEVEMQGLMAQNLIRNTMALLRPSVAVEVFLNQERLQGIDSKGIFFLNSDLRPKAPPFEFFQLENKAQNGYVLTSGYPLKPLSEFLVDQGIMTMELADKHTKGWCLNLPVGSYCSVQSRSTVSLTKEGASFLREFVAAWFYFFGGGTEYIPHFENKVNFGQVDITQSKPQPFKFPLTTDKDSLNSFFLHCQFGPRSLQGYIKDGYDTLVKQVNAIKKEVLDQIEGNDPRYPYEFGKKEFITKVMECFNAWKERLIAKGNTPLVHLHNMFVNKMLFPWFDVKLQLFIESFPTLDAIKEKNPAQKSADELHNEALKKAKAATLLKQAKDRIIPLAGALLSLYVDLLERAVPIEGVPKVVFVYNALIKIHTMAFYSKKKHTIFINLHLVRLSEILTIGLNLATRQPIEEREKSNLVTVVPGHSGTLNHEFEHARRRGIKDQDFHAFAISAVKKQFKSFEGCAMDIAFEAHRNRLFDHFADKWEAMLKKVKLTAADLEACIEALKLAEAESIPALMQLLGIMQQS